MGRRRFIGWAKQFKTKTLNIFTAAVLGFNGLGLAAPMFIGTAVADTANIASASLTSGTTTVTINQVAGPMTFHLLNTGGTSEALSSTGSLAVSTNSTTGQVSSNGSTGWAASNDYTVNSGWSNRSFYYKDSTPGLHTLTATLTAAGLASPLTRTIDVTVMAIPLTVCATGCGYTSLADAVAASNGGDTITLEGDVSIDHQVTITQALTIDGNGHTVSPTFARTGTSNNASFGIIGTAGVTLVDLTIDGVAGTNLHGINVYHSTGVWLEGLTLKNNVGFGNYGLVVNGSAVTINNITTANNFGGIDADKGTVTNPVLLTVAGVSHHSDIVFPGIYVDNTSNVTVNDDNNQYEHHPFFLGGELYTLLPQAEACNGSTFDNFALGSVDGQSGWTSTGPYDQSVVRNIYGYAAFGCQSLRISNAVTSGAFGDQTFSYSTPNEAGESTATNGGQSGGTLENHFEASFDIASTSQNEQPGLALSVSPDRGDGSRMSYLRFEDTAAGIDVYFDDVTTTTNPADWNESKIATLDRTAPHNVKFVIDFVDGPSNDVVKIYIDGTLVKTGTTWENYYRFDSESNSEPVRTVDSLLFRTAGTSALATIGNGFLFDNVAVTTRTVPAPGHGGEGGGGGTTTTPPTGTSTPSGVVLSSTSNQNSGNATSSETNGSVLSDSTTTPTTTSEQSKAENKTNHDNKKPSDTSNKTCTKWGGLCWYWWIPIVLGVAAIIYWYLRSADSDTTTSGR